MEGYAAESKPVPFVKGVGRNGFSDPRGVLPRRDKGVLAGPASTDWMLTRP